MSKVDADILARNQIAQFLLSRKIDSVDMEMHPKLDTLRLEAVLTTHLAIPFPDRLAPVPRKPNPDTTTTDPLPKADVLVITWTVDEQDALADVLTPGFGRKTWTRYNHLFEQRYANLIRPGSPADNARRLGSWCITQIAQKSVLCFKSELHLNQDGIRDGVAPGVATPPVKGMFQQLIEEVQPEVVLTVGTSGGLFLNHDLGDVAVTRGAKFRLQSEFKNADFNGKMYKSQWNIPTKQFNKAVELMQAFAGNLKEPTLFGPTARHKGKPFTAPDYNPDIKQDGVGGIPDFHPILTTDYFEFGTSTNKLDEEGIAVEMGDAVLGMVTTELGASAPRWAVVRNLSDPQINGKLEKELQVDYAVWYYTKYGYWTSIMSALTTWAIIAGLE